jgi:hypothetical protein
MQAAAPAANRFFIVFVIIAFIPSHFGLPSREGKARIKNCYFAIMARAIVAHTARAASHAQLK